jgi:hypothetical protein
MSNIDNASQTNQSMILHLFIKVDINDNQIANIEVVEAQLEGLSFLVLICAITEVCHLCTYVDYINRNTLFSSN